jgi:pyruvate formate lyase activating enzyme
MVCLSVLPPDAGETKPLVFDIRRFALDDGPGIRTTVFLKGCPLSCVWCHNPESISPRAEMVFHPALCIHCGICEELCPEGAARMGHPGRILRERCTVCGTCVQKCPSTALKIVGKHYPVRELVEELMKDRIFYETSRGGVTFSGGEPTLHMDYLGEVTRELKKYNIHIAIQTSGVFNMKEFRDKLLRQIDLIFYDLKLFDAKKHRQYTGTGNEQILDHFVSLASDLKNRIIPRTPLIPNITATEENLRQIAEFIRDRGCSQYELLPYNPGGLDKMQAVGRSIPQYLPRVMMGPEEGKIWKALTGKCLRESR